MVRRRSASSRAARRARPSRSSRKAAGSTFTQRIRLSAGGAGDRVEILTDVDWRTKGTLLKAAFPLAATNRNATYDLGLGVVERPTNRPNLYEVPAQQWADLTDEGGRLRRRGPERQPARLGQAGREGRSASRSSTRRASSRAGAGSPSRARTTSARTASSWGSPGTPGTGATGRVPQTADRLNQPLLAFQASPHDGPLGRSFSLLRLDGAGGSEAPVAVRAVKLAEESDEIVVRLQELYGRAADGVRLRFARRIVALREVNGAEEPLGPHGTGGALPEPTRPTLALADGVVEVSFAPFRPRTLALKLAPPPASLSPMAAVPARAAVQPRRHQRRRRSRRRRLRRRRSTRSPATSCRPRSSPRASRSGRARRGRVSGTFSSPGGQRLSLPPGDFNRLYLLAAAVGGDRTATFAVDGAPVKVTVPDWSEPVGQWNSRVVGGERPGRAVEDRARLLEGGPGRLGRHAPPRRAGRERGVRHDAALPAPDRRPEGREDADAPERPSTPRSSRSRPP